jgi:type I restriction enzyme S subunit
MTNGQEAIPETWRRERLGDISENVFSGGTPSRSNDSYWGGEHYWLSSSELDKGEIYETSETITQEGLDESSTSTFPENSLLIAMYGKTRGKSAINKVEMTGNQAICCLDLKNDFSTEYAWYQVIKNRPRLISLGGGAGQQNIRQSIIRNLKIPIAPLDEQRRIASVLYSMDEQIRTLTDRHDSLTQLKHGLMQDLLTGNTQLIQDSELGMKGINPENTREIKIAPKVFEVPIEWDSKTIEEISPFVTDGTHSTPEYVDDGVRFVSTQKCCPLQ